MEIKELYQIFDSQFQEVVLPYIESKLERNQLSEPVYYYIDNFHIREFRSVLPLLIADSFQKDRSAVLPIGAASELIFYIALVQDDVFDRDSVRGKIKAAHKKFGLARTLASADYCLAVSLGVLEDLSGVNLRERTRKSISAGFLEANKKLYRSFITEMVTADDFNISQETINQIHLNKTAQGTNSLYCTGLALEDSSDSNLAETLRAYSELLARAGQIKNDIYDYIRYSKTRGFSDLENGYINYPLWQLLNHPEIKREEMISLIKLKNWPEILDFVKKFKIIEKCQIEMNDLAKQAKSLIKASNLNEDLQEILNTWAYGNQKGNKNS